MIMILNVEFKTLSLNFINDVWVSSLLYIRNKYKILVFLFLFFYYYLERVSVFYKLVGCLFVGFSKYTVLPRRESIE